MKTKINSKQVIATIFIAFFLIATADISHSIGEINGIEEFKQMATHHDWALVGEQRGFVNQMIRRELYFDESTGKTQEVFICDYRNAHETLDFAGFENMKLSVSKYEHEVGNYTRNLLIYEKLIEVIENRHSNDEPCIIAHDYMMICDEVDRKILKTEQEKLKEN